MDIILAEGESVSGNRRLCQSAKHSANIATDIAAEEAAAGQYGEESGLTDAENYSRLSWRSAQPSLSECRCRLAELS
jgi:hypothetical protein